eukprot:11035966-Ditylum_brightwellii.AAC.1
MAGMMFHAVENAMTTAGGWIQMPLKQYCAISQAIVLPVTHGRKILGGHISCMKQLMNMPDGMILKDVASVTIIVGG